MLKLYKIEERIGEGFIFLFFFLKIWSFQLLGSFGNIFKGKCLRTQKKVALKIIENDEKVNHNLEKCLNEATMLAGLDHPHILKVRFYKFFIFFFGYHFY